jgi:hypothetical protein
MNIPKHVAGIALFITIVLVSVFIAGIVSAPLRMIPPVTVTSPAQDGIDSPDIGYSVQLVSLDFINRKSYATLTLRRDADDATAPGRLWVYTSFYVPELPYKSWSSTPVEIREPFAGGDVAKLTVTGTCAPCADATAPRAGYYARVGVSTVSGEDAIRRAEQMKTDIKNPFPVLVQVEQQPRL